MLIKPLEIKKNSCPLLSDARKYMVAAGAILQSLYPKLFHVTYVDNIFHNCTVKVKSHFYNVDQLIAKVKLATRENKTRRYKVLTIYCLAHLVVK